MDQQTEHDLVEVERWQALVDEAIRERDMAVKAAHKRGASQKQVAAVVGNLDLTKMILRSPKVLPQGWLKVRLGEEEPSRDINVDRNIGYPR